MLIMISLCFCFVFFVHPTSLASTNSLPIEKIPEFEVSNRELVDLVNKMRLEDDNKAGRGQLTVDYQGHTTTRDSTDNAKSSLFKQVDQSLLQKNTYKLFVALNDNFDRRTGVSETQSPKEKQEVAQFLDAILNTKLWRTLYDFLHKKGHPFAKDRTIFRFWLNQLWFVHYSRARGLADTSGFEHVFIGETKNGEISGLHNWLRFYLLERNVSQHFDYKGFLVKRFGVMAAVKFSWMNELKRSGSFVIGSSPEFDMALYTLCFLSRRGRNTCEIEIDGCPLSITSYDIVQQRKVFIGTIYPTAGRITNSCRRYNG
ncbi:unnamed protein product [Anisakis simplex]|uniref:Endoribonuclease n=1 Tax=Anisakis simplex TaxID=6269 RepID=A0A0M3IZY9_ANISI|nr:unnamed protein product [Anisakis simplex]